MWRNWQTHTDLGSGAYGVGVRLPSSAPLTFKKNIMWVHSSAGQSNALLRRVSGVSNPCALTTLYRGFAKSVRHSTLTATCVGSSPASPAKLIFDPLAQSVEHLTFNQGVPRSSRGWITKWRECPSGLRSWS